MATSIAKKVLLPFFLSQFLVLWWLSETAVGDNRTLLELAEHYGCSNFVRLASKIGLNKTLTSPGNLSLFAFADKGYDQLPKDIKARLETDRELLTAVLQGHVAMGVFVNTDLRNELVLPSIADGQTIRINEYMVDGGEFTANGAVLLLSDWMGSNGAYYTVDRVVYPPSEGSSLSFVTNDNRFNTLLLAIAKTDVVDILQSKIVTLFAPTDSAFAKLPPGTLDSLFHNIPLLTSILHYHLLEGTYYSAGLINMKTLKTYDGKNLTISINASVVGNAQIQERDIPTENGAVYVIDTVLLPPAVEKEISTLFFHP